MPTRNIVPNANNEGSLGTSTKRWAEGHFEDISASGVVTLDNGSKLQKGTTDAGLSGNKGIALKCSVDYELKWEAGRLYTMQQDGFTIRSVEHCFEQEPTVNDDETKGFIVGSRWVLDDGTIYECTDATEGASNWQEVVVEGGGGSGGGAVVTVGKTGCDFNATGTLQSPTDHQTIQSAIDSIAQTGGKVFIAAGTYYLGSTINISTPNIAVEGTGRATQLLCVGDYGNVFLCALSQVPAQWPGMSGLQFSNLRFETTVERTSGAAIRANYTHNAIFRDLYICDCTYGVSYFQPGTYPQAGEAFYNGIYLDGQNQCHVSKVTACCINRCVHINGSGYANADFSYDGYIENCNFWGSPGTARGTGIHLGANCGGFVVDFCSLNQFEYAIYANAAGTSQGGGIFTIRGGYAENDEHGYYISGYQNTVVEQLWGQLTVNGGNTLVLGVPNGTIVINSGNALIYGSPSSVSGTGTWSVVDSSGSQGPQYEIKTTNFNGDAGKQYLVNTSTASIQSTLPANPAVGSVIEFADAKGTWGTNALVVAPNGKKIEGSTSNFSVNVAGAFFSLIYLDSTVGWRVLVSAGIKPLNIGLPAVSGTSEFTTTSGSWTGNPSSYSYQWQMSNNGSTGWANISGATSASYTSDPADAGKYVRVGVTATNANGQSNVVYSSASVIASGSSGGSFPSTNLLAFYKLDNANDSSGNGNTLTVNNSVTFTSGKIGNAATFSSGSDSLERQIVSSFKNGAWSFSVWFIRSTASGAQTVVNVGEFGSGLDFYSGPAHGNGLQLYAKGQYEVLGATVPPNTFVHVVLTWTGSTGSVYFNGQNAGTLTQNPLSTAGATLKLGGTPCAVDAVGIWTRAITAQEVTDLYNNGNGLEPA